MATKKKTNTELTVVENSGYLTETVNLAELFSEELDGLRPSFEKVKIPAGGGLAYEGLSDAGQSGEPLVIILNDGKVIDELIVIFRYGLTDIKHIL